MKKLTAVVALTLSLAACRGDEDFMGHEENDLFDRGFDLGLPVGMMLTGTFSSISTDSTYRVTAANAVPVEQDGADYKLQGPKISSTTNSGGTRSQHIVGKSVEVDYDNNRDEIRDTIVSYLVETNQVNNSEVTKTKEVYSGVTTDSEDSRYDVRNVGQLRYWQFGDRILSDDISGDVGGIFTGTLGKVGLKGGMFWTANGAIYRVVGTEKLTVKINGADSSITAVKVEIREANSGQDPVANHIAECVPWNKTAAGATTIEGFNCPDRIVRAYQWWWKNMIVKEVRHSASVALNQTTPFLTPLNNADTDFGYGFEKIAPCDDDNDGGTTADVDCRFISMSNNDPLASADANIPLTIDFSASTPTQYLHFSRKVESDDYSVTEIKKVVIDEAGTPGSNGAAATVTP